MIASGEQQRISYFKRFRMEIDLYDPPPAATLPDGYSLVPWQDGLLENHAEVLYYSFCEEIDAKVFPSLGNRQGCGSLMREIARKPGFLPDATWLVAYTTLVRIPLGTVVLEETLFRGVLLGLGLRRWSPWRATAFASVLFGLWHVLPASGLAANPATAGLATSGAGGRAATVAVAVASTALIGAAWCWLRLRARSLLAPALVHLASNSLGYLVAWLVLRSH